MTEQDARNLAAEKPNESLTACLKAIDAVRAIAPDAEVVDLTEEDD